MKKLLPGLLALVAIAAGCSGDDTEEHETATVSAMHDTVLGDLDDLVQAAKDLQAAAPVPTGRGWDKDLDKDAIAAMKEKWRAARLAYEHVEGALAPIFPELDASIDARYDDFLADNGPDDNLFDDQNVTGLHAAERIIFISDTPAGVVEIESSLPGYKAAAYPATEAEAKEFHDKLLGKIITDAEALRDQWTPAKIDLPGAFTGLVDLMNEQQEKVNKAGSHEEESRYSQKTMADLRANLEGTKNVYEAFRPWLLTIKKDDTHAEDGAVTDEGIRNGFANLKIIYDGIDGDAFPAPPADWHAEEPTAENLATPFGKLYTAVHDATDPEKDGSIVYEMNEAGELLGLQQ